MGHLTILYLKNVTFIFGQYAQKKIGFGGDLSFSRRNKFLTAFWQLSVQLLPFSVKTKLSNSNENTQTFFAD